MCDGVPSPVGEGKTGVQSGGHFAARGGGAEGRRSRPGAALARGTRSSTARFGPAQFSGLPAPALSSPRRGPSSVSRVSVAAAGSRPGWSSVSPSSVSRPDQPRTGAAGDVDRPGPVLPARGPARSLRTSSPPVTSWRPDAGSPRSCTCHVRGAQPRARPVVGVAPANAGDSARAPDPPPPRGSWLS